MAIIAIVRCFFVILMLILISLLLDIDLNGKCKYLRTYVLRRVIFCSTHCIDKENYVGLTAFSNLEYSALWAV